MNRYKFTYIFFLLFLSSSLYSEELPLSTLEPKSIEERPVIVAEQTTEATMLKGLINQVKKAEIKDRRVLMNKLKIQLRAMNKESRHKAMVELKKSFAKSEGHTAQHKHKNHQQLEHKNLHEQQGKHQPQYRHLQNGEGRQGERQGQQGNNGGQGHGRK